MKCVSLWQPWASAIPFGWKRIETRGWWTSYRGPLAIHAAKRWTGEEREDAADFARLTGDERFAGALPLGAIVATCMLTDCIRTEQLLGSGRVSQTEQAFGNYGRGRYGWLLSDIVALPEPFAFRGAQGFFDVPDEVFAPGYRSLEIAAPAKAKPAQQELLL